MHGHVRHTTMPLPVYWGMCRSLFEFPQTVACATMSSQKHSKGTGTCLQPETLEVMLHAQLAEEPGGFGNDKHSNRSISYQCVRPAFLTHRGLATGTLPVSQHTMLVGWGWVGWGRGEGGGKHVAFIIGTGEVFSLLVFLY